MNKKIKLIGIDNLTSDLGVGLIVSLIFILTNLLGVFSLALPPVASFFSTNVGKILVIGVLAPIIEESVFRGLLFKFLRETLHNDTLANIVQGISFGIFHLVAYSGIVIEAFDITPVLAVGGAFISAIIFGITCGYLAKKYDNLAVTMILHMNVNIWLALGTLLVLV